MLHTLRTLLGLSLALAVATGAILVAWPNAWFTLRLYAESPPTALPVPVAGLDTTRVRDSWGDPRSGGRRHEGIDLFAARGTPVLATTHGIVLRIGEDRLGGNVVMLLGPGGQRHYYAHLARFASLQRGQRVSAGTVLGYVGDSGNARGGAPHLHYGIYDTTAGRGALNPYPLLVPGAADVATAPAVPRAGV